MRAGGGYYSSGSLIFSISIHSLSLASPPFPIPLFSCFLCLLSVVTFPPTNCRLVLHAAMAALPMPYHCLAKSGSILFAARGSSIDSFRLDGGALLSTWSCPPARPPTADFELLQQNPPAKRRKLSNGHDSEQVGKKMDSKRPNSRFDSVASGLDAPAVIALTVTHAGNHVIAVTGEDKSVRVFEHAFTPEGNHFLRHLSQRSVSIVLSARNPSLIIK